MKNKILGLVVTMLLPVILIGCIGNDEMQIITSSDTLEQSTDDESVITTKEPQNSSEVAEDSNPRLFYVVYVCGAVNNPGVYEMPENSRLFDAINKAGGYSEQAATEYLNLAKLIEDEEMVYVPTSEELADGGINSIKSGDSRSLTETSNNLVDINKATKEDLMSLPGIGESKANLIISYREENGKFASIEDIMKIQGIKEGLFGKIKDKICAK